jgi:hypothetical protein
MISHLQKLSGVAREYVKIFGKFGGKCFQFIWIYFSKISLCNWVKSRRLFRSNFPAEISSKCCVKRFRLLALFTDLWIWPSFWPMCHHSQLLTITNIPSCYILRQCHCYKTRKAVDQITWPPVMDCLVNKTVYVQRNTEALSCNHYCCGKAINITYSECMSVAVGIQHAKRMRTILLSSVFCPTVPYF